MASYPVPKAPWEYQAAPLAAAAAATANATTAALNPTSLAPLTMPTLTGVDVTAEDPYAALFDKLKPSKELSPGGTIYV